MVGKTSGRRTRPPAAGNRASQQHRRLPWHTAAYVTQRGHGWRNGERPGSQHDVLPAGRHRWRTASPTASAGGCAHGPAGSTGGGCGRLAYDTRDAPARRSR